MEKVKSGFRDSLKCFNTSIDKLVVVKEQMKKLEDHFKQLGIETVKQAIREGVIVTGSSPINSSNSGTFITFSTDQVGLREEK